MPEWAERQQTINNLLANAPMKRLQGDAHQADIDEADARSLAHRFSSRLGQLVQQRVRLLDKLIAAAKKPVEPELPPDPEPEKLVAGRTSRAWLEWVARNPIKKEKTNAAIR